MIMKYLNKFLDMQQYKFLLISCAEQTVPNEMLHSVTNYLVSYVCF